MDESGLPSGIRSSLPMRRTNIKFLTLWSDPWVVNFCDGCHYGVGACVIQYKVWEISDHSESKGKDPIWLDTSILENQGLCPKPLGM